MNVLPPDQAIQILDQISSQAPVNFETHQLRIQALQSLQIHTRPRPEPEIEKEEDSEEDSK